MTIEEPGYFESLARVEASHWWSRAMWRLALEWLDRTIRGRRGLAALDIGCGAGLSMIRLAGQREITRIVGIEPDPRALRLARRFRGFELLEASVLDVPFENSSFDVVTCFDVIQHLPEGGDRVAAREISRVLRPGGVVVVRSNSAGFGKGRSKGGTAYRLNELIEILTDAGLQVLRASYANCLPALAQELRGRLRLPGGARVSPSRSHPSGGGLRVNHLSPRLNRFMVSISTFEQRASTLLRCPLPFGHSTMILAVKPGGGR